MKELKDMNLRLGDRICFSDGIVILYDDYFSKDDEIYEGNVLKIERPVKYATIYEAPKQILDKDEKAYLEAVLKPAKENIYLLKKEFVNDSCYRIRISNNVKIDKFIIDIYPSDKYSFKEMQLGKEYTLDELGLFEEKQNDKPRT